MAPDRSTTDTDTAPVTSAAVGEAAIVRSRATSIVGLFAREEVRFRASWPSHRLRRAPRPAARKASPAEIARLRRMLDEMEGGRR
jgi:hypothetical protein